MSVDGGSSALLVALAFLVMAVGLVLLARRRSRAHAALPEARVPDSLPPAHPTSSAGRLVSRAEAAVNRIRDLSRSPGDPWLRAHVGDIDRQSTEALGELRVLAGRVTVVEQTIARADPGRLRAESLRLRSEADQADNPSLRDAYTDSLAAVDEQLATVTRLSGLREELIARMEPVSIGLESVAARMGEIVAIGSETLSPQQDAVTGLNQQLESLRTGLSVAQSISESADLPDDGPSPSA